jgi:hypothetical protein
MCDPSPDEKNLTVDDALELVEDEDKGKSKWIKHSSWWPPSAQPHLRA